WPSTGPCRSTGWTCCTRPCRPASRRRSCRRAKREPRPSARRSDGMNQPAARPIDSILVVDDSPSQRDHAARLCRALGVAEVHQASDGAEALAMLARLNPAPLVMIVDIEMPGMNGVDLLEELRIRGIQMDL